MPTPSTGIVGRRPFDGAAPPVAASSPVIALVALGLALVTLSSHVRWPLRARPPAGGEADDQKRKR